MKYVAAALALLLGASAAQAQSYPDLKGTWIGKGKSVVYGTNPHHPGAAPNETTPRIREFEFTLVVSGQDGPLVWGQSRSSVSAAPEPFAWSFASDGKTIVGADTDGYHRLTVVSRDRLELCYTHAAISPSKSIVATCGMFDRKK
ncbi:MAG TPA: hypothetical protein VEC60_02265 [Reyranella sp.]|nr:hypothetical protein [Reyranella sp.]